MADTALQEQTMSTYSEKTWHPVERRLRNAQWIDDYFGRHQYGVRFDGEDHVYRPEEVNPPAMEGSEK
jgi:hypothetical protein